jgi:cytochrome c oxidase subunit 4
MATHQPHAHHPSPKEYVKIAIVLAVLTAIEVALFYVEDAVGALAAPLLVILAFLKFVIVIGWYMHLRFEKPTLSRFFSAGFILALFLYAVVLASFGILAITGV